MLVGKLSKEVMTSGNIKDPAFMKKDPSRWWPFCLRDG